MKKIKNKKALRALLNNFFVYWEKWTEKSKNQSNIFQFARHQARDQYHDDLLIILDEFLYDQERTAYDLLYFLSGNRLLPKLMEKSKSKKSTCINSGAPLSKNEMQEVIEDIITDYSTTIDTIKKCHNNKEINKSLTLDRCLVFAEKHNLFLEQDETIKQKIKLVHFGLDWKIAANSLPRGKTLTIDQSARLISEKLGEHFLPHNLLEECLDFEFGAYIDYERYSHFQKDNPSWSLPAHEIEQAFANNNDPTHLYHYDGLLRLIKDYKQDVFDEFVSQQTLKHLCNGGRINLGRHHRLLCVQLSLSEIIIGKSMIIAVKDQPESLAITINDLRFREQELFKYIDTKKQSQAYPGNDITIKNSPANQHQSNPIKDDTPLERCAIIGNYNNLTKSAWEKNFQREKVNGLIDAKIQNKKPFQYSRKLVEKWLTTKNHYSIRELKNMDREKEPKDKQDWVS